MAGWSYPDWDGYVYPPGVKDRLRYVAEFVDVVEINSTFYRPPAPATARSWANRTDDLAGFAFTAKIHQEVTHRGLLEPPMVTAFHRGFEPLTQAGRLAHLLAQFKWDFADSEPARAHLRRIRDAFGDITNLALELRHNSWESPDARRFLTSLNCTVANLDYPTARNSFNLRLCDIGEHAYFRLHGRNYKAWFSKGSGRDETYNYLYNAKELGEIVDRALAIGGMSKSLTLVANNHYQGKEMANALQIKAMLTGAKVRVPQPLAEKYPDLRAISAN